MSVHIPIVLHASLSPPIKTIHTHIHGDACMHRLICIRKSMNKNVR